MARATRTRRAAGGLESRGVFSESIIPVKGAGARIDGRREAARLLCAAWGENRGVGLWEGRPPPPLRARRPRPSGWASRRRGAARHGRRPAQPCAGRNRGACVAAQPAAGSDYGAWRRPAQPAAGGNDGV